MQRNNRFIISQNAHMQLISRLLDKYIVCYGSIPDGVTGIFHLYNPSGRTMSLGLTNPPTEMNTMSNSWGSRRQMSTADYLITFMC
jgi:hypothetical protein